MMEVLKSKSRVTILLNSLHMDADTLETLQLCPIRGDVIRKVSQLYAKREYCSTGHSEAGYILVSKKTIRIISQVISEEIMIKAPKNIPVPIKELGIITDEHPLKPSLADRLNFVKLLGGFNGFPTEIAFGSEIGTTKIDVRSEIGRQYSLYMAETMKIFLEEATIIDKFCL